MIVGAATGQGVKDVENSNVLCEPDESLLGRHM